MNKKINWVELNLPFKVDYYVGFVGPELNKRKLLSRFKKQGNEIVKAPTKKMEDYYFDKFFSLHDHDDDGRKGKLKNLNDPIINCVLEHKEFIKKYDQWLEQQPEFIEWAEEYDRAEMEFKNKQKQLSFCGRGLNKPGTLIEVVIGGKTETFLIGDVNCLGGVCDDCMMFDRSVIVKRYAVVWER